MQRHPVRGGHLCPRLGSTPAAHTCGKVDAPGIIAVRGDPFRIKPAVSEKILNHSLDKAQGTSGTDDAALETACKVGRWKAEEIDTCDLSRQGDGMPRLSRTIGKSVFFLYRLDPRTGERTGPHGSRFFVTRKSATLSGEVHYYAVTNKHVACTGGASDIRINTRGQRAGSLSLIWMNGTFSQLETMSRWRTFSSRLDIGSDRIACNAEETFITKGTLDALGIGPGEDTFMCGLFFSHYGRDSNVPSFRFENLSMLASDNAPVEIEGGSTQPVHFVDTRSRTGFSGSPVSFHRVQTLDLTRLTNSELPKSDWGVAFYGDTWPAPFLGLLGIHCGQFQDVIDVRKSPVSRLQKEDTRPEIVGDPIHEGNKLRIEGSMTTVAPAWCISEVLDLAVFEKARNERDEQRMERTERRPRDEG